LGAGSSGTTCYRLPVYADGSLGHSFVSDNLSVRKTDAAVVATPNFIHLLGGNSGGGPESTVLKAGIVGSPSDFSFYYGTGAVQVPTRLARLTPGAGRPWEQQYHFNTTQSAAFGSTIQYQTAPIDISDTQVVVTKDKAFFIAGTQSLAVSNTVKKVDLLPDGTLDFTWTNWNNLPKQLDKHQVVTVANKVYVMGGVDEQGTYSSSVYKSVIDQNGELGEWVVATSLPIQLAKFACAVVGDAIYTYGGLTVGGTRTANCYKAVLDADGEITGWSTNGILPQPVSHASIAVTANYVYLIGGHNTTGYINNVYRATIDSAGQVQGMADVGSGPVTARFEHCLVTRSHVYLMQAYDGTNSYLGRVYAAPITSQGTIGAWSSPFTRAQVTKIGCVNFVVGGKMYMVGGSDPTLATPSKRMYVTAFAGGSNDYSLYYGKGVVKYSEPTKFYLPYVNKPELSGVTYYVKY
ncbi:MAG: hypothetical protein PHN51_12585, partial [Candidatus Nanopelagicales bacterium]|nr:hypothetical protein [Candidatus Nanopelagicales bacterium]